MASKKKAPPLRRAFYVPGAVKQKKFDSSPNEKTPSFEEVFVPGAGVEPARFPTGV